MSKQSVCLVEFNSLYNILIEIDHLYKFKIFNYQNTKDFLADVDNKNSDCINSTIIIPKKNNVLSASKKVNINNLLLFEKLPIKIEKLLDVINTQLIKQKYNFQSNLNIKSYVLNLNSRIISNKQYELKLTEREIDIILFLKNKDLPISINILQNEVWGYSFGLETHTVETHIYRLRKKIKDQFSDESFIVSVENGYKL
tara:strand:+ start:359 stop:955 length:597 start_codon:yes stop_codon:yes gene_type:complete